MVLLHFYIRMNNEGGLWSGIIRQIVIYCLARGLHHVQVNSRRLQGLKELLVILKSQGLDLEIDSIIGRYHPPTHHKTFLDPITLLSLHEVDDKHSG